MTYLLVCVVDTLVAAALFNVAAFYNTLQCTAT